MNINILGNPTLSNNMFNLHSYISFLSHPTRGHDNQTFYRSISTLSFTHVVCCKYLCREEVEALLKWINETLIEQMNVRHQMISRKETNFTSSSTSSLKSHTVLEVDGKA